MDSFEDLFTAVQQQRLKDGSIKKGIRKVQRASMVRHADLLVALDSLGGEIVDPTGRASVTWRLACRMDENRFKTASGFTSMQAKLEQGGWIERDVRGKRTMMVRLARPLTPEIRALVPGVESETPPAEPEPEQETEPESEPEPETEIDATADELGMRPGRLAARIEKAVPELVRTAVMEALQAERDASFAALGYYRGVSPDHVASMEADNYRLDSENARLKSVVENLNDWNRSLQAQVDYLTDAEDARLFKTNDGQVASKQSLTVSQLPPELRRLGAWAFENGWTIRRTRGGHLAWRNPEGKTCFSASTPGDVRIEELIKRKTRRLGLPDIPRQ